MTNAELDELEALVNETLRVLKDFPGRTSQDVEVALKNYGRATVPGVVLDLIDELRRTKKLLSQTALALYDSVNGDSDD